jgi:hypothetical protein
LGQRARVVERDVGIIDQNLVSGQEQDRRTEAA